MGQLFEHGTRAASIDRTRAKAIAVTINTRLSRPGPWFASLDLPRDANEKAEIQKAVAEWADRDRVAALFAYTKSYLCSEDRGVRAGSPSIFDAINQTWLRVTSD